jgi:hypothetical protein
MVLSVSTGKESEMRYLLQKCERENHYDVINDDADSLVGSVYPLKPGEGAPGYRVDIYWRGKDHEIAVKSLDDAIPAVAAFYEANPPQWEPEATSPHAAPRWSLAVRAISRKRSSVTCGSAKSNRENGWLIVMITPYPMLTERLRISPPAKRLNALPMLTFETVIPTPKR